MPTASANRKTFSEASHSVSHAIDHLLNQGAEKLYDKYISAKIPSSLSSKLANFINVIFDPVTNPNHQRISKKDQTVHEPIINKINLAKQGKLAKKMWKQERSSKIYPGKTDKFSILKHSREGVRERKNKMCQICTQTRPQRKDQVSSECKKLIDQSIDFNDSIEIIRANKATRYSQQRQKQIEDQRLFQQSERHREQLQNEFKHAQLNNQPIAIDYETCRILAPEPGKAQPEDHKPKNHMVYLRFQLQDQRSMAKNGAPREKEIKNIRKITTFERVRKCRQHEVDNESYNNNQERQYSTIPYIEVEEGVRMTEGPENKVAQRPQTSRKTGTASTHRTFKSYTRERLESIGAYKTIDIIPTSNTRYLGQQSKESKRTSHQTPKRSLLWSSRTCTKDHRINKNLEHFGEFFDEAME